MTPDEEVQQVLDAVSQLRARHAAFTVACQGIHGDQFHPDVQARWDNEGNLRGIDIAPNALRDYTNLELEDIISDVMRRTRLDVGDKFQALFDKYLGFDSPSFDPDILGVPMAPLLRTIAGQ
ncbi:MAG: type I secretion protein TolC [Mycobacterium sp.]|nr:type I secretion protein TolC [Mycobacterium sp.]